MLITFRLPEWPAAATALVRFVVALGGEAGIQSRDKDVRVHCMDLWGTLTAQAFYEAELAEQAEPVLQQLLGAPCSGLCPQEHSALASCQCGVCLPGLPRWPSSRTLSRPSL